VELDDTSPNVVKMCDITIRPLAEDDIEFLVEVRNDCRHFLHNDKEFTLKEAKKWFSENASPFYLILYKNEPCGYFRTSKWNEADGSVWIGADLSKDFRGRGIASLAYPLFMDMLYRKYGLTRFILEVLEFNTVALCLYRKLGFNEVERRHSARGTSIRMELWHQQIT